jgi:hypothetical protein
MIARRFSRGLALRGPDLARWPESERNAALRLLGRSAAARRRYLAALDADTALDADAAAVDPAVTARLMAGAWRGIATEAHRSPHEHSAHVTHVRLPVPAMRWGALAACAVLGVWVGWTASATAPPSALLASLQITPMMDSSP